MAKLTGRDIMAGTAVAIFMRAVPQIGAHVLRKPVANRFDAGLYHVAGHDAGDCPAGAFG
ncbi:MAG: hypothetical protein JKX69_13840 [Rhodobacteraceae bacterium]|nr:hypothetical protein [Paracoccaceae bacterium]